MINTFFTSQFKSTQVYIYIHMYTPDTANSTGLDSQQGAGQAINATSPLTSQVGALCQRQGFLLLVTSPRIKAII